MTNHLVPTPLPDRNGKIVTRHLRPKNDGANSGNTIPIATLATKRPSKDSLYKSLERALIGRTYEGVSLRKWVNQSTEEELAGLDAALDTVRRSDAGDDSASWEAQVIRTLLQHSLSSKMETPYAHGLLASREAFVRHPSSNPDSALPSALPMYKALFLDMHGKPLPEDQLLSPEQNIAALDYCYGVFVKAKYGAQCVPFNELFLRDNTVRPVHAFFLLSYKSRELLQVVLDNDQQLDKLIDYAVHLDTSDPEKLRALMDGDTSLPVADGWL